MRFLLPLPALALLAACGDTSQELAPGNDSQAAATQPAATSSAEGEELAEAQESASNTALAAGFDWTGTYAATPALCQGGRWRFSRDKVVTEGETSCRVGEVDEGADRAVLQMACMAEGMNTTETWTLTRTGENGFRVERDTGSEKITVDLSKCPSS